VDKPPAALWIEALSVKLFGFNSLAILVPQALMGVASVGLLCDLTRRRWGRIAGTVAGLALALTPIVVAISRHNNPDALLVLCSVGALWCFIRALEHGATKWLVFAGICVGLGFEAKMGAALMVLPGMALAYLWVAPRGRLVAIRQLAWAGAALAAVALAWPVLVWLTPAASRPWISGTSDNSIWSLIWEYNGLGRLEGQTGGPGNLGAGGTFGGPTGAFRLLNEALGGQAGWLLGTALAGGVGIAALSRLRRTDPRTGWIIAVGGAFGTTAVAFSFAGGIFHPYYTSLLAPFAAALVGATVGQVRAVERGGGDPAAIAGGRAANDSRRGGREAVLARMVGAVAIGLGAVVELIVIDHSASDLDWLVVPLVIVSVAAAVALLFADALAARLRGRTNSARIRLAALACAVGILLVGPAVWSVDTLGHPTSSTFPAGGPESASTMGGPGGMGGGPGGGNGGPPSFGGAESGGVGGPPAMTGSESGALPGLGSESTESGDGTVNELFGESSSGSTTGGPPSMSGGMAGGAGGGMFGGEDLSSILAYTEAHGGGTIAVDSQSGASASIIEEGAEVAGIGGFSGKESTVSAEWLEERIADGDVSWIYTSGLGSGMGGGTTGATATGSEGAAAGGGGDTRTGSESAIDSVVESCTAISSSAYSSSSEAEESTAESASGAGGETSSGTLYKCGGS